MENFLRKIKLIDSFSVTLNTTKAEFTSALHQHVDQEDIDGWFSSAFEVFTSSKNRYKGNVSHNGFRIRKRMRFFERNIGKAIATGRLRDKGDVLCIDTEINGWNNYMIFFYSFLIVFYLIFLGTFMIQDFSGESEFFFIVPIFIIIHAMFMFGLPYFMMRRSVKRFKEDLEREFYYIINKPY